MRLPIIALEAVHHVGTLDPADLGRNSGGGSLEGRCLSVSLCPNAWQSIARLGGYPLHRLEREDGVFLDVHAVLGDETLTGKVVAWAKAEGLVADATVWRGWSTDEDGEWRYSDFPTRERAVEEIEFELDLEEGEEIPGPDGREGVEPVAALIALPPLAELVGMRLDPAEDARDAAVMAWAMACLPDLGLAVDGLWWREDHDPHALSAPRGCVFPEAVPAWEAFPMEIDDVDDGEELSLMPDTEWIGAAATPRP